MARQTLTEAKASCFKPNVVYIYFYKQIIFINTI